jgi:hypothetical protein
MQRVGWSKVDAHRFHIDAYEVELKTISLRVTTTANPNRDSLTQNIHPNTKPNPTPKDRKKNQKIQPTRESTRVLRIEKIGSSFKIILLVTESAKNVITKRTNPRNKLLISGNKAKAQRLTPIIQVAATARSAFLYDGRVNMEE